jgi:hypothetical protein
VEYIAILLMVGAFATFMYRKRGPKKGWHVAWSEGVSLQPQGTGWAIDVPTSPGHLNYVQLHSPPAIKRASALRVRIAVEGGPFANPYLPNPSAATLLIQRKGQRVDDMNHRFFSGKMIELTPGEHELTIPLAVEHWGGVNGEQNPEDFRKALDEVESIGIVFGGAGGRGHGISGSGRITLRALDVL